jgi:hypothetical protein
MFIPCLSRQAHPTGTRKYEVQSYYKGNLATLVYYTAQSSSLGSFLTNQG